MAEFAEVMRQWGRLCDYYSQSSCHGCPVDEEGFNCACEKQGCSKSSAEELEAVIMSWAAEHPEPVYPTWGDWLAEQGVVIKDKIGENKYKYNTLRKVSTPIPADMAERLEIEPEEGEHAAD